AKIKMQNFILFVKRNVMEQEIAKIKKFKLECKNCETQIIIDTHNSIKNCPVCGLKFYDNLESPFENLHEQILLINKNKNVKVYFVCEEKEKR
ncbi:TPA: hypothetical protein ACSC0C_001262, partial [Campylobacter jejuni]